MSMQVSDFGRIILFYFSVSGLFLLLHQALPHSDGSEIVRTICNSVIFVFVSPFISSSIKVVPEFRC